MDFKLPLFNWNFDLTFYFSQSTWQRIFSFDLNDFELFGTSVAVQLLTFGFALCADVRVVRVQWSSPLRHGGRCPSRWRGHLNMI